MWPEKLRKTTTTHERIEIGLKTGYVLHAHPSASDIIAPREVRSLQEPKRVVPRRGRGPRDLPDRVVQHRVRIEAHPIVPARLAMRALRASGRALDLRVLVLAQHVRVAPDDEVRVRVLLRELDVRVELVLVAHVVVLGLHVVRHAVDRERALEHRGAVRVRVALVVHRDARPSELVDPRWPGDDACSVFA